MKKGTDEVFCSNVTLGKTTEENCSDCFEKEIIVKKCTSVLEGMTAKEIICNGLCVNKIETKDQVFGNDINQNEIIETEVSNKDCPSSECSKRTSVIVLDESTTFPSTPELNNTNTLEKEVGRNHLNNSLETNFKLPINNEVNDSSGFSSNVENLFSTVSDNNENAKQLLSSIPSASSTKKGDFVLSSRTTVSDNIENEKVPLTISNKIEDEEKLLISGPSASNTKKDVLSSKTMISDNVENGKLPHNENTEDICNSKSTACQNTKEEELPQAETLKHESAEIASDEEYIKSLPVTELKFKTICELLNSAPNDQGVHKLAAYCNFYKDDLILLEYGNSNCALEFLKAFQVDFNSETVKSFKTILKRFDIDKAVDFLNNCKERLVSDLSAMNINKLSFKLITPRASLTPDWEDIAEHYRMDVLKIKQQTQKHNECEELRRLMKCKYVNVTIGKFLEVLNEIGNNEVRMEVEKQITEMLDEGYAKNRYEPSVEDDEYSSNKWIRVHRKIHNGCIFTFHFDQNGEVISSVKIRKVGSPVKLQSDVNDWNETVYDVEVKEAVAYLCISQLESDTSYDFDIVIQKKFRKARRTLNINYLDIVDITKLDHTEIWKKLIIVCHVAGMIWDTVEVLSKLSAKSLNLIKYAVYQGAGLNIVERKDWFRICLTYLYRNFSIDGRITDVITCFCDYFGNPKLMQIATLFGNCCRVSGGGAGLVVTGYNLRKHLSFLGFKIGDKAELQSKLLTYKNEVLVYESSQNIILFIRMIEGKCLLSLHDELNACCDDIKLLALMNKSSLVNTGVGMFGVVALPDISNEELELFLSKQSLSNCRLCRELILTKEDLSNLNQWWDEKLQHLLKVRRLYNFTVLSQNNEFEQIISSILGFIATSVIHMPTMSSDLNPHEQIVTIMLNREQLDVLRLRDKKVLLTGCFGSGKSLVGKLQLEKIAKFIERECIVYYISYDSLSLLDVDMKRQVELLKKKLKTEVHDKTLSLKQHNLLQEIYVTNMSALCQELNIADNICVSDVLHSLAVKHANIDVHVVIDEYDAENLDLEEAEKLYHVNNNEMKDSFVMIIPQSLEKRRTMKVHRKVIQHNKYQYNATGMKVITLSKAMRNTNAINNLLAVARNVIQSKPSMFQHPRSIANPSMPNSAVLQRRYPNITSVLLNSVASHCEQYCSEKEVAVEEQLMNVQLEYDEAFKYLDEEEGKFRTLTKTFTETNILYSGDALTGHSITGKKPVLMNVFTTSSCHAFDEIASLIAILRNVINKRDTRKTAIVCLEEKECHLFAKALKLSQLPFVSYTPVGTTTDKIHYQQKVDAMRSFEKGDIILTTVRGFRGLETANVIMFIKRSETFLCHRVVESIARCTSNLTLITFEHMLARSVSMNALSKLTRSGSKRKSRNSSCSNINRRNSKILGFSTLSEVINQWVSQDLLTTYKVRFCSRCFKRLHTCKVDEFCQAVSQKFKYLLHMDSIECKNLQIAYERLEKDGDEVSSVVDKAKCEKVLERLVYNTVGDINGESSHPDEEQLHNQSDSFEDGKESHLDTYMEVYETRKKSLGDSHPLTLKSRHTMASYLKSHSQYQEALAIYKEVFEREVEVYGPIHEESLNTHENIAFCLRELKDFPNSLIIYQDVLEKRKQLREESHPNVLKCEENIGICLLEQGSYHKALSCFRALSEKEHQVLDTSHPFIWRNTQHIAFCLLNSKSCKEALKLFEQVFDRQKEMLGVVHPVTLKSMKNMAVCLERQCRYREAWSMYLDVCQKQMMVLGLNHCDTLATKETVVQMQELCGHEKAAEMQELCGNL